MNYSEITKPSVTRVTF